MPSFEVDLVYISLTALDTTVSAVQGVSGVVRRRPFSRVTDVHLQFHYRGVPFIVLEMYGDNSRYWIGPAESGHESLDISALECAFRVYRPPLWRRILGDILTLRLFRRHRGAETNG